MIKIQEVNKDCRIYRVTINGDLIKMLIEQYKDDMLLYKAFRIIKKEDMYPRVLYSNTENILYITCKQMSKYNNTVGLVMISKFRENDFFNIINKINNDIKPRRMIF